jgi:predicted RNase H-like HicB family nuclease
VLRKISVVIERDEGGRYAWCPELQGCQSQGATIEQALANIHEAAQRFLDLSLYAYPTGSQSSILFPSAS